MEPDPFRWFPCPVCGAEWDPTLTEQVFVCGRWFDSVYCFRTWCKRFDG